MRFDFRPVLLASSLLMFCACGTTAVHPQKETARVGLPRPQRILVYDLATSEADISPNTSSTSHARARMKGETTAQRSAEVARDAVNAFGDDLVEDLRKLGFEAARAHRGAPANPADLIVAGEFVNIDEGNRLRRIVIGFGSGESNVDTRLRVYQGSPAHELAAFTTHSDSGKMPGTAVTMTAGAVATGGVGAAAVASEAAVSAARAHRSATAQMAGRSADQASAYLSEFFAKQGWIADDKMKHARRG